MVQLMMVIETTNSGKKPDLQILLKLNTVRIELILAKVLQVHPSITKKLQI